MTHLEHTIERLPPFDPLAATGIAPPFQQQVTHPFIQRLFEEGGFAGARNPRDTDPSAQREVDIDPFQIVLGSTHNLEARALLIGPESRGDSVGMPVERGPCHRRGSAL